MLNGEFQDGVNTPPTNNYEITAHQFDEAITHELGHFSGLDHSQINLDLYQAGFVNNCNVNELAGLPLMFPVEFCQSRKSGTTGVTGTFTGSLGCGRFGAAAFHIGPNDHTECGELPVMAKFTLLRAA